MADEQPLDETSEIKEPAPEPTEAELKAKADADAEAALKALDPKKVGTHPPVTATAGQVCQVEGCGWTFGDPVKGIEPHPTVLVGVKPLPNVEPPRPTPPAPKESTAKCGPVGILNTCPSCGWNATESAEPHPVIA